jgi:hypothetical protein
MCVNPALIKKHLEKQDLLTTDVRIIAAGFCRHAKRGAKSALFSVVSRNTLGARWGFNAVARNDTKQ